MSNYELKERSIQSTSDYVSGALSAIEHMKKRIQEIFQKSSNSDERKIIEPILVNLHALKLAYEVCLTEENSGE